MSSWRRGWKVICHFFQWRASMRVRKLFSEERPKAAVAYWRTISFSHGEKDIITCSSSDKKEIFLAQSHTLLYACAHTHSHSVLVNVPVKLPSLRVGHSNLYVLHDIAKSNHFFFGLNCGTKIITTLGLLECSLLDYRLKYITKMGLSMFLY